MSRYKRQTTIIRSTTIVLLAIAWFSSICTLILGFIDIAHSSTNQQDLPTEVSPSLGNATISSFYILPSYNPSDDLIISKLGASIGLISTAILAVPVIFAIHKVVKPERVDLDETSTGTSFPRWVGAIISLYSTLAISVTAALTHDRQSVLKRLDIAIVVLCFVIGVSTLFASLLVLIKPRRIIKLSAPRRRYLTYEIQDGYYTPRSEYSHYSFNDKTDKSSIITTPPRLESPMIRSHSVQRKRVDYFHYLFDEEVTPYASESGHQSLLSESQRKRASSTYMMASSTIGTCSSSLHEVNIPTLNFDHVIPAPKAKAKPKVRRARVYEHQAANIAMLPIESKCISTVSL